MSIMASLLFAQVCPGVGKGIAWLNASDVAYLNLTMGHVPPQPHAGDPHFQLTEINAPCRLLQEGRCGPRKVMRDRVHSV